jgi:glucosamine 6-phosphate synthetase-like amidotransferase/phosphosugar isomerase protein
MGRMGSLYAEGMSGSFLKHGTIALIDVHTYSLAIGRNIDKPHALAKSVVVV